MIDIDKCLQIEIGKIGSVNIFQLNSLSRLDVYFYTEQVSVRQGAGKLPQHYLLVRK